MLCLGLLALPSFAVEVEGLYRAHTDVTSRSDARERQQAFSAGLREVLVKVSGREDVLQLPAVRNALSNAEDYVDSWSYNSRPVSGTEGGSRIELELSFFPAQVQALLSENGIPVWPSNRPLTLVWVITEDELGQRRVLSTDEDSELLAALRTQAGIRGMPMLLPLMDLDDVRALNIDRLWNLDSAHVRELSARYATDSILVLRVFNSLGNEFLGRTRYLYRNQQLEQELYGSTLTELTEPAIRLAANELAAYFAVLLNPTEAESSVLMRVDGVQELADYAGLLKYVEGLSDVREVQVVRVADDRVELRLLTGGQLRQLLENVGLSRTLRQETDAVREGNEVRLHYRWLN